MDMDMDLGLHPQARRDDGRTTGDAEPPHPRRVGEMLLELDELEETLRSMEDFPAQRPVRAGESREDAVRTIEAKIRARRERIDELQGRGEVRYDEIDRAMRVAEAMG